MRILACLHYCDRHSLRQDWQSVWPEKKADALTSLMESWGSYSLQWPEVIRLKTAELRRLVRALWDLSSSAPLNRVDNEPGNFRLRLRSAQSHWQSLFPAPNATSRSDIRAATLLKQVRMLHLLARFLSTAIHMGFLSRASQGFLG